MSTEYIRNKFSKKLTKTEYDEKLAEINSRQDLSPKCKRMAINSLNKRYENDVAYHTPDESGFSQADRDALQAFREDLIWKAQRFGLQNSEELSNVELQNYINKQKRKGIKPRYDESEVGTPDYEGNA